MSEYLSEEEQIAQLKSWWDEYGNAVIIGLVLAVGGIVGWQWYGAHSQEQNLAASAKYIEYQGAGEAEKAALGSEIASEFRGSAYHAFVLFEQAQDSLAAGELTTAAEQLEGVIAAADEALLVDMARIRLAKVQRALDQKDAALATLSNIRHEGFRSWALETKGDIHSAADEVEQANLAYQAAMDAIPEGEQRPLLKMKLENTAPFNGAFVQLSDPLADALREARESLEEDADQADGAQSAVDAVTEVVEEAVDGTEQVEQALETATQNDE